MCDQVEQQEGHEAFYRLTFERWTKPAASAGDVHGSYSRAAWLPVIGPTAWLIWGAVTDGLGRSDRLDRSLSDLGRPWGYAPEDVSWALLQLARYGLALPAGDDRWQVTTICPPLPERLLPTAPKPVQALHRKLRSSAWTTRRRVLWGSVAFTYGGGRGLLRVHPRIRRSGRSFTEANETR